MSKCKQKINSCLLALALNIMTKFSVFLLIVTHFSYLSNSNIAVGLNIKTNKLDHYHIYIYIHIYSTSCTHPPSGSNTYSLVLLLLLPSRIRHCSWQCRYHYHFWHTHTHTHIFIQNAYEYFFWHYYKLKNAVRSMMCNVYMCLIRRARFAGQW
jgi:hypothetical protein